MPRTTVVHCKKSPYTLYIGRPSKWGNPFVIGKDGTREEVLTKYHSWLKTDPASPIKDLEELRGHTLACWCKPARCHGDILKLLLNTSGPQIPIPDPKP